MDFSAEFLSIAEERDLLALRAPHENPAAALTALHSLLSHKRSSERLGGDRLPERCEMLIAQALQDSDFAQEVLHSLPLLLVARLSPAALASLCFVPDAARYFLLGEHPLSHLLVERVADCFVSSSSSTSKPEYDKKASAHEALETLSTLLLQEPNSANWPDADGARPLHWAVCLLSYEAIEVLLEHNADAEEANALGAYPFDSSFFELHVRQMAPPPPGFRVELLRAIIERHTLEQATRRGGRGGRAGSAKRL